VDPGSAAEAAGLRLGDRIVEVNGHSVVDESHKEVVQRIKTIPNETKLLVIDPSGQLFYAERNIAITSSMPNVQKMKTPATPPVQKNNRPIDLKLLPEISSSNTNGGPPPLKSSLKVSRYAFHFFSTANHLPIGCFLLPSRPVSFRVSQQRY
jgi:membrane-associated protease RseP (regulator of RpoE activity)